MYKGLSAV